MSNKLKAIFIHGNGGGDINDPTGWFPYLKVELEKLGIEVTSENFPDPIEAKESVWLPHITSLGADENTILIGHSSGAVAALRYAQNYKILGSALISACYTDLGMESEKISGYYNHPWDWEAIKNNQQFIIQFHSTDDPLIPVSEARFIHDKTDSDYYEFNDYGHFGYPKDVDKLPELVEAIKKHLTKHINPIV